MNDERAEFLAGARPQDVVLYFANEAVDDPEQLAEHGETVEGGLVLTLPGEQGRSVFQTATGTDPMAFARQASGVEATVDADLLGGTCPDEGDDDTHDARFLFAFSEDQKEDMEGLYERGDVIHAYVQCECGTAYSERWLAGAKQ
jgi:hypothetical protein